MSNLVTHLRVTHLGVFTKHPVYSTRSLLSYGGNLNDFQTWIPLGLKLHDSYFLPLELVLVGPCTVSPDMWTFSIYQRTLWKFLEFFLWITPFSWVLCPENSSCIGLPKLWFLFLQSRDIVQGGFSSLQPNLEISSRQKASFVSHLSGISFLLPITQWKKIIVACFV